MTTTLRCSLEAVWTVIVFSVELCGDARMKDLIAYGAVVMQRYSSDWAASIPGKSRVFVARPKSHHSRGLKPEAHHRDDDGLKHPSCLPSCSRDKQG